MLLVIFLSILFLGEKKAKRCFSTSALKPKASQEARRFNAPIMRRVAPLNKLVLLP